ncbi:MAG: cysteine desulfurase [Thermoproteota archaeon]|nr:cysteine desulfurase [Thermoproteota archaeon]
MTKNKNKNKYIYLDNAASTPIDKKVIDEMLPFILENYGNPSSLHKLGRYSRQGILNSRFRIAKLIGADIHEVYFTSGGTESNNLALIGSAKIINKINPSCDQIIVSEIEHDSVLETISIIEKEMKFKINFLPVNGNGIINEEKFNDLISSKTGLISIMLVNNEIGTIQPVKKLADIAKSKNKNIIFHTDAVQALGKIPMNVKDLNIDLLSISSHKINGPKGAGALYIKHGINLEPILFGGGQEKKLRSGTENVQSIVGFGKACDLSTENLEANQSKIKEMQNFTINKIIKEIPFCKLNGSKTERIPNNVNFSFLGVNGEDLLIKLDENEIASSTGSACSSNKKQKASHVLKAIGLSFEEVTGSIRFSIGYQNTREEIETAIIKLKEIIAELRKTGEFDFDRKKKIKKRSLLI